MKQGIHQKPEQFLSRLRKIIPQEKLESVLEALNSKTIPSIRVNTFKITPRQLSQRVLKNEIDLQRVSWNQNAFTVLNKTQRELTELEEYKQGLFYIQNLSSMIPALVIDPKPSEKILDIAAAPGSKTTQMALLMHNKGEIVANDMSRGRVFKLISNLKEQAVTNTRVTQLPGQTLWKQYPEYFDKTLVDVPCSMEGRINLTEPKTYQDWSLGKIRALVPRQQYLLRSAISATKPGGIIVYSSCTLAPEENEGVIDWILKKEQDAVEVEKIEIPNLELEAGITYWNKQYNPQVKKTARILPSKHMEGFFIAKIKKRSTTIST